MEEIRERDLLSCRQTRNLLAHFCDMHTGTLPALPGGYKALLRRLSVFRNPAAKQRVTYFSHDTA